VPFDQKLAAQAAKLGKPFAEIGKGSKTTAAFVELATQLCAAGDASAPPADGKGAKKKPRSVSLIGKFTDLKAFLPKKPNGGAKAE